jgi:hypothetical protein
MVEATCIGNEGKEQSTPSYCDCMLKDGQIPHPSTYTGCSHAREEMLKKKSQKAASKGPAGRLFSSMYTTPEHSFAAALRSNTQQKHQPHHQIVQPQQVPMERKMLQPPIHQQQHTQQSSGQPVQALYLHSATGQNVQSGSYGTADYDKNQQGCV